MQRGFLYFSLIILGFSCIAVIEKAKKAPLRTIQQKNKEADAAFIKWRLEAPGSTISPELRSLLTPEAVSYLVDESQLPFNVYQSKKKLKDKVSTVMKGFLERFEGGKKVKQFELEELITEVILPEYTFQIDPNTFDKVDKTYNTLLDNLAHYKTTAGTLLNEWALRFLTSESQFVALSVIERATRNGTPFNALPDSEKVKILSSVAEVVTRRFINNLNPVKRKFGFTVPPYADMAVKKRVDLFLRAKFGL